MDSDTQVFEDIAAGFKNSPTLRYTRLGLSVEDGIVTISGRVSTLAERKAVERIAKRVAGIKTLVLEISAAVFPSTVMNSHQNAQLDARRTDQE